MPKYKIHCVQHPTKKFQTCKETGKINHNEEENQSISNRFRNNTDDRLRKKNVKIAAINILYMLSM